VSHEPFFQTMVLIFYMREAVVVVIVWIPMHSVPNTTYFLSSNLAHSEMYLIQHYVIKFVSDLQWFSPVSSPTKLTATI